MYGWIIDNDCTGSFDEGPGCEGVMGPSGVSDDIKWRLAHKHEGEKFRMYDDDNILYFEGRQISDMDSTGFEPLDDFGMPGYGCTRIDYLEDGSWNRL